MNQPEKSTGTDKTLDASVFAFLHLGRTLGNGLVTIGPEKENCIAEGGFAIMYKGEVNPIRYRQKLVLEGKKDPIAIFGVKDAEQEDGKFVLTQEQINIVNRVADEKVAYYADHPEDKQILMSVLEEKGELQNLECAVKVLKEEALKNPNTVERFRQEYAIARNILDHPNIVKCLDLFIREELEGGPHSGVKERKVKEAFIVYELVPDAMQLGELIHKIPIATIMDIMRQTLEGIIHAHDRGIIHRDLKPSNILLYVEKDENGEPVRDQFGNKKYVVKITDYGVAKATHTTTKGHLTGSGDQYLGSPHYMSPEQAAGEARTLNYATDIFSLGSTFYYILTGELPFHGDSGPQVLSRVSSKRPPAVLRHENPKIHPRIEDLILKLMAPDRLDRPSAVEALDEVNFILRDQAFLSDKPTVTPLRTIPEVLKEIRKTNPEHYSKLGHLYAEMASLTPRVEIIPRALRKYVPRLKKLEKQVVDKNTKNAVEAKKKLESLHKDLGDAIERFARKNKTAQYYYDLASVCFKKAHPDEGIMAQFKNEEEWSEEERLAEAYRKKAAAEKYRIQQLVERVEEKPPGFIRRIFSNPFAMTGGVLFVAGSAVVGTLLGTTLYENSQNQDFFESAKEYHKEAKKDLDSGDLENAKSDLDLALNVYDQISKKDYNEGFESELDSLKKLIERAMQDVQKERQMAESFSHLDTLIANYKFSEAKEILDNAERILIELG
ncbi:serine/threonine protein kinase, partial [Candidatus Woesearchaeota archaeon]|nr:serine/threonine protein kinase [Candidatus Woesearchaeota archaeon]